MAYTLKLDTNVVTPTVNVVVDEETLEQTNTISYILSTATIELNDVKAYYSYVDIEGKVQSAYTYLQLNGSTILVDETYATIDGLLNP
tara:strand:+ start:70 stop:333 length:264 start_codon:yes stop_codon:yes gene_type:complete